MSTNAAADILRGEQVVYFGPEPWAGLWRNRHQLMSRLAATNDVYYVEPPVHLKQLRGNFSESRTTHPSGRSLMRDASGVNVVASPWWLPVSGSRSLGPISMRLYFAWLRRVTGIKKARRAIVWLSRPHMASYVAHLESHRIVYHVVDEYTGYDGMSDAQRESAHEQEQRLMGLAEHVIVVTETLLEEKKPFNARTHLVPNAANFDAYAETGLTVPHDLSGIPGPVIGYSGLIAARLDLDMLTEAAKARPEWSFVFVGSVNDDGCEREMAALSALPNVHMLGRKPVDEMPAYVSGFDVSIIPYRDNLRARHSSPLKMYEYAAAGKPLVATDFPAARAFGGHIYIAGGADAFIEACQAALGQSVTDVRVTENRDYAALNTWEHRVGSISRLLSGSNAADRAP